MALREKVAAKGVVLRALCFGEQFFSKVNQSRARAREREREEERERGREREGGRI